MSRDSFSNYGNNYSAFTWSISMFAYFWYDRYVTLSVRAWIDRRDSFTDFFQWWEKARQSGKKELEWRTSRLDQSLMAKYVI